MSDPAETVALVVVDVQNDYLTTDISPPVAQFVESLATVLDDARSAKISIAHVRTVVSRDGSDAMPHRTSAPRCVEGTAGARPPEPARELDGEPVFAKRFFDAFENPDFEDWLCVRGVTTIVLAGAYTHACVHHTAVSAYARGFRVVIASEAVASDRPELARESLEWLADRAVTVAAPQHVTATFASSVDAMAGIDPVVRAAVSGGNRWESNVTPTERATVLEDWATTIEAHRSRLVALLVREIRKPAVMAEDEVTRTVAHIRSAAALSSVLDAEVRPSDSISVAARPLGVVALLMPWNNPLAIPAGKIAAALVAGNSVILKPAPEAVESSRELVTLAYAAGIPGDVLGLVDGGVDVAQALIRHPHVDGVAVTGSIEAGRSIADVCVRHGKPLQAELGGNNAVIVAADADFDTIVPDLVRNAFAYSGQRCTAIRRWVVDALIADEFTTRALTETARWTEANPEDRLISSRATERLRQTLAAAVDDGVDIVCGGTFDGDRMAPTVVRADPHSRIVQTESFGPIAVIQIADNLDHAIELANGVEQGLVAGVCSTDPVTIDRAMNQLRAGIIQVGGRPVPVHPDAPFGGWKASGIGSPEHGVWDLQFFTRPQARYAL